MEVSSGIPLTVCYFHVVDPSFYSVFLHSPFFPSIFWLTVGFRSFCALTIGFSWVLVFACIRVVVLLEVFVEL